MLSGGTADAPLPSEGATLPPFLPSPGSAFDARLAARSPRDSICSARSKGSGVYVRRYVFTAVSTPKHAIGVRKTPSQKRGEPTARFMHSRESSEPNQPWANVALAYAKWMTNQPKVQTKMTVAWTFVHIRTCSASFRLHTNTSTKLTEVPRMQWSVANPSDCGDAVAPSSGPRPRTMTALAQSVMKKTTHAWRKALPSHRHIILRLKRRACWPM